MEQSDAKTAVKKLKQQNDKLKSELGTIKKSLKIIQCITIVEFLKRVDSKYRRPVRVNTRDNRQRDATCSYA